MSKKQRGRTVCRLVDIAEKLGISVNTVSHALHDKDDVSDALKQTVQKAAQDMGYVANISAGALRTGRSHIIAMVYDKFSNPYYSVITELLQARLIKKKYSLIIFTADADNPKLDARLVRKMMSRGVDAIISFLDVTYEAAELIKKTQLGLVILGSDCTNLGVDSVSTDNFGGGYLAVKHLLENGHRDILMLSAPKALRGAYERTAGFKRAIFEAGFAEDDKYILTLGTDGNNGRELIHAAFRRGVKFSAVFGFNDYTAYEAMTELIASGYKIPDDVSVIGYDHLESDFPVPVGLTSIGIDKTLVAELTTELLLSRLAGTKEEVINRLHSPALVIGRTVKKIDELCNFS